MIDGRRIVDGHVHAARLPTVKVDASKWAPFPSLPVTRLYDEHGVMKPGEFDDYLEAEGVDVALLFAEYSPRVTGIQAVEDLLPIVEHNPQRFRIVANVNPYYHYPVDAEVARQAALGAVALKVHPVHGAFAVNDRALYPAYAACQSLGLPVIVHTGTSSFPGALNKYGDPALLDDVLTDFPGLNVILAHGGRGWWYETAAFLALNNPCVWIDIAGLPPKKLPHYFRNFDFRRLADRFMFGSDWPGAPGIRANVLECTNLRLDDEQLTDLLGARAIDVYGLDRPRG